MGRLLVISFLTGLLIFSFSSPSIAKTYKFRDENGKLHFTNDPEKVPEQYRQDPPQKSKTPKPAEKGIGNVYKNDCVPSKGEYTALHAAAKSNNLSEARLLLSNGADIEARDNGCFSPLQRAVFENNLEMVKFLLSEGANPNVVSDGNRDMLLRSVITMNKIKLVELLIKYGANVNATTIRNKTTALMQAADFNRLAIIQLLLDKGAYINARNDKGLTALGIAMKRGNEKAARLLKEQGAQE